MTELVLDPGDPVAQHDFLDAGPTGPSPLARVLRPFQGLRAVPSLGIWAGVLVSAVGLVLIAVAWGRTAGLTQVALQVPYAISAGVTGLALVVVGATAVSISAKRADAQARREQSVELRTLIAELRSALGEQQ